MKSSFDWDKISRTGQIGHKAPHKAFEEHRRELREQLYPGMTDEEIREAEHAEMQRMEEKWTVERRREQAEVEALRAHYAAAYAAGNPAECDYAVVKVDKCFGLSIVEQLATPHTGGVPGVCRISHLGLANAHLPMVLSTEGEFKFLLLRSNVTNHNVSRRQAFFDSVQRFFDYRRSTPQWTGGKAHELRLFPRHIPTHCTCRHCRRTNSQTIGSNSITPETANYNELTPAEKYWEMCRRDVYKQDSFPIYEARGLSIHINTDEVEGKEYVNYFKVFNSKNWKTATKVCRISFLEPVYVYKENRDGCRNWILTTKQKIRLISILKERHHRDAMTVYESACSWCNDMNRMGEPIPADTIMPDYSLLPEE